MKFQSSEDFFEHDPARYIRGKINAAQFQKILERAVKGGNSFLKKSGKAFFYNDINAAGAVFSRGQNEQKIIAQKIF